MVRQCAWCLRLINGQGERISSAPLPKLYEASHGICSVCGTIWIEQACNDEYQSPVQVALEPNNTSTLMTPVGVKTVAVAETETPPISQIILQIHHQKPKKSQTSTRRNRA